MTASCCGRAGNDLDFLQQVEQRFLDETGYIGGSPYLFRLTAD